MYDNSTRHQSTIIIECKGQKIPPLLKLAYHAATVLPVKETLINHDTSAPMNKKKALMAYNLFVLQMM
jgi:hypothetical protein